jgi:RND family efflux transporter MFP subunit
MFDFLARWRQSCSHAQHVDAPEDKNIVRLLVITRDDRFSTSVQDAATACGWEFHHTGTIESGLDALREFPASVAIYDWPVSEEDWRPAMDRLSALPHHPCLLLASPVDDEYLCAELVRHGGFDVIPRTASQDRIIGNIRFAARWFAAAALVIALTVTGCSKNDGGAAGAAAQPVAYVGTAKVETRPLAEHLTVSSELVPYQEIDVYAKEAGYVKDINVDYGSHVHKGQVMAILEVPELEAQLQQDEAAIKARNNEVTRAENEVSRAKAQRDVLHVQYTRLAEVSKTRKGLVAQQEVDDSQSKDLAAESNVDATQASLEAAKSEVAVAQAKLVHDQALFDYSKIVAPFDGVVTQRYANEGALMQAGTTSVQATPLVRLSDENLYRLVIPIPESDVKFIRIGDPVEVRVPSLDKVLQGKVARFSSELNGSTRTMHTEVNVPNPGGQLVPGLYAEAVVMLNRKSDALVVPVQALNRDNDKASVFVVGPDNRIESRPVTLGLETPNYAEVASGVRAGEQVVVSDRGALKAGQIVQPKVSEPLAWEGKTQE